MLTTSRAQEVLETGSWFFQTRSLPQLVNDVAACPDAARQNVPGADLDTWQRRSQAVARLSRLGTNGWPAIPALVGLLGHSEFQVSVAAATVLASIKADEYPRWAEFQGELRQSTNAVRSFLFLTNGKDEYGRPYDLGKRRFGLTALAAIGPLAKAAGPPLLSLFRSRSERDIKLWGVLAETLNAVGVDHADVTPLLRQTIQNADEDVYIRASAIQALADSGSNGQDDRDLLRRELHDDHSQVRVASARALWKMNAKAEEVLPTLLPLLEHKLPSIRIAALAALTEIGEPAWGARSAIARLLEDDNGSVRNAAATAMQRIPEDSSR
jgi:HEAT repeat protein